MFDLMSLISASESKYKNSLPLSMIIVAQFINDLNLPQGVAIKIMHEMKTCLSIKHTTKWCNTNSLVLNMGLFKSRNEAEPRRGSIQKAYSLQKQN